MSSTSCIELAASHEQLCYIPCSFCNIVLAVSVPCNNLFDMVTVRCGHCTNLWSVNMGMATAGSSTSQDDSSHHQDQHLQDPNHTPPTYRADVGSSSRYTTMRTPQASITNGQNTINRPPEKRTRVPSAYNQFIKQEIQRIKANNPNISHREAFSAAAKNWAHFPHIHFGVMLEDNNHQDEEPDELSHVQGSNKRLKSGDELVSKYCK